MLKNTALGWRDPAGLAGNNFDFLRLTLAVFVIFSHSFDLLRGVAGREPLRQLTDQTSFGDLGVDGFFVISGFLVTHSWFRRKNLMDYVWKRARRIYPGFVVACCACVFLVGPLATDDPWMPFQPAALLKGSVATLVLRGDFQDYAFPSNPYPGTMNGSTWSIPYEARCYAGVVLLAAIGWLKGGRVLVIFAGLVGISFVAEVFNLLNSKSIMLSYIVGWPRTWTRLAPLFVAGMAFYLYRDRIPFSNKLALVSVIATIAGALLPPGLMLALPVFGTYLLFWLAYHPRIRLHQWAKYGDFSYGTYLYAFPIQQLLIRFVPAARDPLVLCLVATPLAIACGAASWYLVERRFLPGRQQQRAAVAKVAT